MEICELGAVELAAALRAPRAVGRRGAGGRARSAPTRSPRSTRSRCGSTSAPAPRRSPPTPSWPRGTGGPLCGVPLTVKDSHYMAGVPTTFGSQAVEPLVPPETVAAVERLEAAGAVIFAKTATPEFCYAGTTPGTGNPHDPSTHARAAPPAAPRPRVGGRRRPARAGRRRRRLDPHPGRVLRRRRLQADVRRRPARAQLAGWKTLVAYGPLARSVADARLMFDVLAGARPARPPQPRRRPRRRAAAALRGLRGLGSRTLDDDVRDALPRACVGAARPATDDSPRLPAASAHLGGDRDRRGALGGGRGVRAAPELLGPYANAFLAAGDAVTTDVYVRAQIERERIHRAYARPVRALAACCSRRPSAARPSTARSPAPAASVRRDWGAFLFDANLAGLPACAIPMGLGDEGLPVSLQITGPRGADGAVLAAAEHIEEVLHVARYV